MTRQVWLLRKSSCLCYGATDESNGRSAGDCHSLQPTSTGKMRTNPPFVIWTSLPQHRFALSARRSPRCSSCRQCRHSTRLHYAKFKRAVPLWNGPKVRLWMPPGCAFGARTSLPPKKFHAVRIHAGPTHVHRQDPKVCLARPGQTDSAKRRCRSNDSARVSRSHLVSGQAGNTFDLCSPKPAIPKVTTSPPCRYC